MTQEKFERFRALHRKGQPLVLNNIWDAGSARASERAGAPALATGSWSVADAQGYADGQEIPLDEALGIIGRIVRSVAVPVSADFEDGYAEGPAGLAANVRRLVATGAVGMNFEDRAPGAERSRAVADQLARIRAVRAAAGDRFFLNARTDLFLAEADAARHPGLIADAIARGQAYAEAGADGFFIPGTLDLAIIAAVCAAVPIPVNVMVMSREADLWPFAAAGVARVSRGPGTYLDAMNALEERVRHAA